MGRAYGTPFTVYMKPGLAPRFTKWVMPTALLNIEPGHPMLAHYSLQTIKNQMQFFDPSKSAEVRTSKTVFSPT